MKRSIVPLVILLAACNFRSSDIRYIKELPPTPAEEEKLTSEKKNTEIWRRLNSDEFLTIKDIAPMPQKWWKYGPGRLLLLECQDGAVMELVTKAWPDRDFPAGSQIPVHRINFYFAHDGLLIQAEVKEEKLPDRERPELLHAPQIASRAMTPSTNVLGVLLNSSNMQITVLNGSTKSNHTRPLQRLPEKQEILGILPASQRTES